MRRRPAWARARCLVLCVGLAAASPAAAQPTVSIDLAGLSTAESGLLRAYGSSGDGSYGVPVAGGHDCDDDGFRDLALAAMRASPLGRSGAGEVLLVFGDGTTGGSVDTSVAQERVLRILGDGVSETTGSEIWIDDVTGDGVGDLLIARQNHAPDAARPGAGALSILVGGPELRAHAATLQPLDLRTPPAGVTIATFVGAAAVDRLGIWMRTGDVTGDGIPDIVVGADQEDGPGETDRGAAYVIRGGAHLAANQVEDLADFGQSALRHHVARVVPPPGATEFHFGATCQIADLDGNARGEVLVAAALNRAGAALPADGAPPGSAHANRGSTDGTLYVAWDDNFPAGNWTPGLTIDLASPPGSRTIIDGGAANRDFGEEILGGLDYDADGTADLFVGDLVGDGTGVRPSSGIGHVLYGAGALKGLVFDLDAAPPGLVVTTFHGAAAGDIAADTAAHGDFDGDGLDDLSFSSPHATVLGRSSAGSLHVFFGQSGPWPALIDLAALPPPAAVRITEVYGANGSAGSDHGDTLCYSAAAGDLDDDGRTDLITNEMLGNGLAPGTEDVGNAIVLAGPRLAGIPRCDDGLDDDRDGTVDGADPGCDSASDDSERSPSLLCDDGQDNDGDGRSDFDPVTFADAPGHQAGFGDPGCSGPGPLARENPQCQDGVDNDAFSGDPDRFGSDFDAGLLANQCVNGFCLLLGQACVDDLDCVDPNGADPQCIVPWRNCERVSCRRCGLGFELVLVIPALLAWHRRRRRLLRRG